MGVYPVKYSETVAEVDTDVMQACARLVMQMRPVLPLDGLAVVLLEPGGDTSRVVFSWGASHQTQTPRGHSVIPQSSFATVDQPSMCINLEGRHGPLGAVLFRCSVTAEYGPEQESLVKNWAQHLALTLENIQLQSRLERQALETRTFGKIAGVVASDVPIGRVYRRFAGEIKQLLEYQRLSVYLADSEADLLTCVYQVGRGVRRSRLGETRKLTGSGCEMAISCGQGYIVKDNLQTGEMGWPELSGSGTLRSALIVPIDYVGNAIGAVVTESRWPNAYGPNEQKLLQRIATLLGPRIANSMLYARLKQEAQEHNQRTEALRAVGDALGANSGHLVVLDLVCRRIGEVLGARYVDVWVQEDNRLVNKVSWGHALAPSGERVALLENIAGARELPQLLGLAEPEVSREHPSDLVLPLVQDSRTLGYMVVGSAVVGKEFSSSEVRFAEALAAQAATALEKARLDEEGKSKAKELAVLDDIAKILGSSRSLEEVFGHLAAAVNRIVPFHTTTLSWVAPNGCDISNLRWCSDLGATGDFPEDAGSFSIHAHLVFRKRTIGSLTLWRAKGETFANREQDILERLGALIAPVVDNMRLYQQARRQAYQLHHLNRLGQSLDHSSFAEKPLRDAIDRAIKVAGTSWAAVYLRQEEDHSFVLAARARSSVDFLPERVSHEMWELVDKCFRTSPPQPLSTSLEISDLTSDGSDSDGAFSVIALPLEVSRRTIGVLVLGRPGASGWNQAEVDSLRVIAAESAETNFSPQRTGKVEGDDVLLPLDSLHKQLLVDVAHALRTPLAAIKGYSSALLQSDVTWPPELHQEFLETIDRETDRLTQVVNELLAPSHDDAGAVGLNLVLCTVQSLFDKAKSELAAKNWQWPVEFCCQPDLPPVSVDLRRLVQVTEYLVRCSAEMAGPDGALRVEARLREGQPDVVISRAVQDGPYASDGRGLEPSAAPEGDQGGSWMNDDLRVIISRALLDAHGVTLRAGLSEDPSRLFSFSLPVGSPSDQIIEAGFLPVGRPSP